MAGFLHDQGRLLPCPVDLLFRLLFCLGLGGFRLLGALLRLKRGGPHGFHFVLHFPAALLQPPHHLLKGTAFLRYQGPGPVHDTLLHAQTAGNGESVGLSRDPNQQPIGGAQGGDIKFTAAVFHSLCLQGVGLQLRVMGGTGKLGALQAQLFNDGGGQRRSLYRIGARAQLVQQHKAVLPGKLQNMNDIRHMGGKGGKRLLDALFVSDVRQNVAVHRYPAVVPRRDHETTHGHQSQKAQGFQGHGFTAGVGAGDDQRIKALPQGNIGGHYLFLIDQRVTGLL